LRKRELKSEKKSSKKSEYRLRKRSMRLRNFKKNENRFGDLKEETLELKSN